MLRFDTALGKCGVSWTAAGISEVLLPGQRTRTSGPLEEASDPPAAVAEAVKQLIALLAGEPHDLRWIALDESALDPFRQSVYAATRAIDPGATASYGEIAKAIGDPQEARAVGTALGRNPFPIVVPCHRVLAADGALHGFSAPGGIATKRRMLEIEGAAGFTQQALFA